MQTGRTAEAGRKQEETEEKMSLPFAGRRRHLILKFSGRSLAASAALVVALVVTLVVPAGAAAQQGSWAGTWDTSYGRMVLSQTGSTVTGTYESCTGRVTGTVSGARLSGTWVEQLPCAGVPLGSEATGPFEFDLQPGGATFTGRWGYASDPAGTWQPDPWTGTRVSPPLPPAQAEPQRPPEPLTPADGATFTGRAFITFTAASAPDERPTFLWLYVSRSPTAVDPCGTIGNEVTLGSATPTATPGVFEFKPGWIRPIAPGTYYWQVYRISYANGADGCIESPVRRLVITAAAKPPSVRPPSEQPGQCSRARRPPNGQFIVSGCRTGRGRLTIKNGLSQDGVIQLTKSRRTVVAVYVRRHASFTVRGVRDGTYTLYFKTGTGWNSATREFVRRGQARKFDRKLRFVTRETDQGVRSTIITVTLHRVAGGNAPTSPATPPPL